MSLEPVGQEMAVALNNYLEKGHNADTGSMLSPMLTSIAISLKRIADKIEPLDTASLENQLLDIAYKAGLNFRG